MRSQYNFNGRIQEDIKNTHHEAQYIIFYLLFMSEKHSENILLFLIKTRGNSKLSVLFCLVIKQQCMSSSQTSWKLIARMRAGGGGGHLIKF